MWLLIFWGPHIAEMELLLLRRGNLEPSIHRLSLSIDATSFNHLDTTT